MVASNVRVIDRTTGLGVERCSPPDNILLDEDDNIYLADFGIAKDIHPDSSTADRGVTGTPDYMSPEQFLEKSLRRRAICR